MTVSSSQPQIWLVIQSVKMQYLDENPGSPWQAPQDSAVGNGDKGEAPPALRSSAMKGVHENQENKTSITIINHPSALKFHNWNAKTTTIRLVWSSPECPKRILKDITWATWYDLPLCQGSHRLWSDLHEAWLPTATRKIWMTSESKHSSSVQTTNPDKLTVNYIRTLNDLKCI